MAIASKVMICNMAQSHLGNFSSSIMNIDAPVSDAEVTYAQWFDAARQIALEQTMPNFAVGRRIVSRLAEVPVAGYAYYYERPSDCLRVLGVGDIDEKLQNNYSVEDGKILTSEDYPSGMPIRAVFDKPDPAYWTTSFGVYLSWQLAALVALQITGDVQKANAIEAMLPMKMANLSAINSQESRPVRISRSRFKSARFSDNPGYTGKR